MWKYYALLSAFFAALTAILAKKGVSGVTGNVATAIRTLVIVVLAWIIVFASGEYKSLQQINRNALTFLILSGLATGCSWIFYFKALETGPVSKIAPIDKLSVAFVILLSVIFLGEKPDFKTIVGGALIITGSIILIR